MRSMTELVESLEEKNKERDYLISVLKLWAHVQEQGIDPDNVDTFGYSPMYLTPEQKKQWHQKCVRSGVPSRAHTYYLTFADYREVPMVHNYVRLKTGEVKVLDPMLPVPRKPE